MEPREFICNIYGYEWLGAPGGSGAFPNATQVNNWIGVLQGCEFSAVGFNELVLFSGPSTWNLWGSRTVAGDPQARTILEMLRDAGLKVLLRIWAGVHESALTAVAAEYGAECIGLNRDPEANHVWSLNVYRNGSLRLLTDFVAAIKNEGVYDAADWVSVGWDDSGEVDDIQAFAGRPTLTRPVRIGGSTIERTEPAPARAPASGRAVRIHDANEAIGIFLAAALNELGSSKPIGCMRGSCWHVQYDRRNLPFFPDETLAQTNDVNQLSNDACSYAGFTSSPVQREALAFACDILRGSGASFAVEEADALNSNFEHMEPPTLPHPSPFDEDEQVGLRIEVKERSLLAFGRGIHVMFTHFPFGYLADTGDFPWSETCQVIAGSSERTDDPLTPVGTVAQEVTGDNQETYIGDAIDTWQAAPAGSETASKPVSFRFSLP